MPSFYTRRLANKDKRDVVLINLLETLVEPQQTGEWQLPAASVPAAVPSGASLWPQKKFVPQVRVRQMVSVPGQSATVRHCTHAAAWQNVPLFWAHAVPSAFAVSTLPFIAAKSSGR